MKKIFLGILLSSLLTACSPVDSVQVFDEKQARLLLSQHIRPQKQELSK